MNFDEQMNINNTNGNSKVDKNILNEIKTKTLHFFLTCQINESVFTHIKRLHMHEVTILSSDLNKDCNELNSLVTPQNVSF